MEFDTIAAIYTPMGEGAIAIVRLSGDEAITIAAKIFKSPTTYPNCSNLSSKCSLVFLNSIHLIYYHKR